jgi:CzcA family heavy metal efflux pump
LASADCGVTAAERPSGGKHAGHQVLDVVALIRELIALSLKFRVLVITVAVAVLGLGFTQLRNAPVDEFPEFAPTQVQVQAEALGLSAAEVEQLITVPLEQDLLNGVPWLDQIRSESLPGLSSIDMIFQPGTDVLQARQMVQEHLTQAHALPQVGTPPVMIQPLSSTSRAMMIGLEAKDLSLIDLSILSRWKIKPRLMGLPGVANVAIWGQRDRQLQVQVDPDQLRKFGVTLSQVIETTGNALWVSPLTFVEASTPGTGGFIDTSTQRFAIQHVLPITTAKGLAAVSLRDADGKTLRLGQVARVVEDHQPLIGDAVLDNSDGLMLVIQKFPEANTREVAKAVSEALADMKPGLSGISIDTTVYRPATFIDTALHNLARWAVLGLILVVALLGGALLSWRVAVISVITISLSLVIAGYVLYLRGATFNVMVLAGLTAALGIVIDEAVVDVDTIRRRLREDRASGDARSSAAVLAEAVLTVRGPLSYATLVVVLAPLPALALDGVSGSFARPLVLSYVLAVTASALVALTVTPALAILLLGRAPLRRRTSPLGAWLLRGFDRVAPSFMGRPRWVYGIVAILIVAGVAVLPQLGGRSLVPSLQDRDLLVHWQAAPGTSLAETTRITDAATRELRSIGGVRHVGAHLGRALMADQPVNVSSGELWVSVDNSADYAAIVAAVKRVIQAYPGLSSDVMTYPQDRVRSAETGTGSDLVVRVYGHDLTMLATKAEEIRGLISGVRGVQRPIVATQAEEPTLEVKVNLAAAERYGISPGDVRRASATYFAGLPVGSVYEEQKVFDVVVWSAPSARYTPNNVRDLLIDTPAGGHVRLGDVADVSIRPSPTVIKHDNISRSIDITASVSGRNLGAVMSDVKSRIRTVAMPLEYHAEVLGDAAHEQNQRWRIAAFVLVVAIGIFLLLQAAFGSWRLASLLMLTLPLAGVGAALAAFLIDFQSFGALIGLLAVLGIAARNGILLLSSYQRREQDDGEPLGPELILRATRERVEPVVLTALATASALLPLMFWGTVAGTEVSYPLAVVMLGGLVTATLVTVFVLPALYLRFSASPSHARLGAHPSSGPAPV